MGPASLSTTALPYARPLEVHLEGAAREHAAAVASQALVAPLGSLWLSPPKALEILAQATWTTHPALLDTRLVPLPHGIVAAAGELAATAWPVSAAASDAEGPLTPLVRTVRAALGRGHDVVFAAANRGQGEQLREMLLAHRLDVPWLTAAVLRRKDAGEDEGGGRGGAQATGRLGCIEAPFAQSFTDRAHKLLLISTAEVLGTQATGRRGRRARQKRRSKEAGMGLENLLSGAYVIHQDFGIGRYEGLVRLNVLGQLGDFLHLVYADGDKLYIPVYNLSVLYPYRGPGGSGDNSHPVKLDKLGSQRWLRAKQRVRDSVLVLAHSLLAVQAKRAMRPGFGLEPPGADYQQVVGAFPYEETPDQARAIAETLADLGKRRPMDRLICGDVGFGKTEVAVRAAALAVLSGRQVAVLVPTTVLAEQHGTTFKERLSTLGVRVEVFSRFSSPQEAKAVVAELALGQVDVIIGTHRLLGAEVQFKDLGLLVIDEEQRFGVRHKERLKRWRADVHVLTLSATPIPRTLHMASLGLRDLSLITTPPLGRIDVKTEIVPFAQEIVATAIRRELKRGGQVFVVHNRVQSIERNGPRDPHLCARSCGGRCPRPDAGRGA